MNKRFTLRDLQAFLISQNNRLRDVNGLIRAFEDFIITNEATEGEVQIMMKMLHKPKTLKQHLEKLASLIKPHGPDKQ